MHVNPAVLLCPLDWGLGHASRLIPVVQQYIHSGYKVMLGGDGKSMELLKHTFPGIPAVLIPCYKVRYYGKGGWLIFSLFWQLPSLVFSIFKEHRLIRHIIADYNIGIVVSDNRYGLFSRKAYCIFITHQISPVLPFLLKPFEFPLYLVIKFLIHRFDECWIPDCKGRQNISGNLSHRFRLPENARFIGILSRFSALTEHNNNHNSIRQYDLVVVLSGPQPSLGNFTRYILNQIKDIDLNTLIIGGLQDASNIPALRPHIDYFPHIQPDEFMHFLLTARYIICRAGYSGIMDLISINRTALIIPTSGQSEQEYLAKTLQEKGLFHSVNENELNLKNDLTILSKIKTLSLSYCQSHPLPIPYFNKNTTAITENPSR